jgi:hypothetical protein
VRTPWIRNPPGPEENRQAAGLALGLGAVVGVVVFYFGRILLARERIDPPDVTGAAVQRRDGEGEEE